MCVGVWVCECVYVCVCECVGVGVGGCGWCPCACNIRPALTRQCVAVCCRNNTNRALREEESYNIATTADSFSVSVYPDTTVSGGLRLRAHRTVTEHCVSH